MYACMSHMAVSSLSADRSSEHLFNRSITIYLSEESLSSDALLPWIIETYQSFYEKATCILHVGFFHDAILLEMETSPMISHVRLSVGLLVGRSVVISNEYGRSHQHAPIDHIFIFIDFRSYIHICFKSHSKTNYAYMKSVHGKI